MRSFSFAFVGLSLALSACGGAEGRAEPETDDGYVPIEWVEHEPPELAPCEEAECGITKPIAGNCDSGFFHGFNYAWRSYGGDFGGWRGVSQNREEIQQQLQALSDSGVKVVRWWMFPDFGSGAIEFDADGLPTGLAARTLDDVQAALEIAAATGVSYQLTLLSFNNFDKGQRDHNLNPIATSEAGRSALINNVVRPLLANIAESPNADRVHSWDVMNEPEWAIDNPAPYGSKAFSPQDGQRLDFPTMETLIMEITHELHLHSDAPVTVGSGSPKWVISWKHVGLDFYTVHIYSPDDALYPYGTPPSEYGLDKPVVLGEFPMNGMPGIPYENVASTAYDVGYIGVMGWAMNDRGFGPWSAAQAQVQAFTQAKNCSE